jgi:hypothetical protein
MSDEDDIEWSEAEDPGPEHVFDGHGSPQREQQSDDGVDWWPDEKGGDDDVKKADVVAAAFRLIRAKWHQRDDDADEKQRIRDVTALVLRAIQSPLAECIDLPIAIHRLGAHRHFLDEAVYRSEGWQPARGPGYRINLAGPLTAIWVFPGARRVVLVTKNLSTIIPLN